eukprot:Pgem_evm1s9708
METNTGATPSPSYNNNRNNRIEENIEDTLREIKLDKGMSNTFGLVVGKSDNELIIVCTKHGTCA